MTVLTAIQQACTVIGLDVPLAVFGSTEREHVELAALTLEMAERIKEEHDWNKLKTVKAMAGDGVLTKFPLPTDYSRMLKESQLWSSARADTPLTHIQDLDTWLADIISGAIPDNPQWTIYGDELYINPIVPTGETVSYFYIKSLATITADADVFSIGERLLTLGIIWQWKANKGLPYAEDMQNYEITLKKKIDQDMGATAYATGLDRYRKNTQFVTIKEYTP